jgi:hypothetical protein
MPVRKRLEHALQLGGLIVAQARLGEGCTALDEREGGHEFHHIEED